MSDFLAVAWKVWGELPLGVTSIVILVGGFLGATLMRVVVGATLGVLRFDRLGDKAGLTEFLRKGGVTYTPSKLVSLLVFWLLMGWAVLYLSRILDIQVVTSFTERVAETLPGAVAALGIIVVGLLVTSFLSNFTRTILRNAGSSHADLISKAVRYTCTGLILLIAIDELNFGKTVFNTLITIFAASLGLALALAFGLGCKDMARAWLQRVLAQLREEERSRGRPDLED